MKQLLMENVETMSALWTPTAIKKALVQAFEVDQIVGGRVGPKMYGNAMPAYYADDLDIFIMEREDLQEAGKGGTKGAHFATMKREREAEIIRKRRVSSQQVSQMERILLGTKTEPSWISGFLQGQDGARSCIEAYAIQSAMWSLRGRELKQTRLCKRMGWAYPTYLSRRDRAADMIAWGINERGVECWMPGEGEPTKPQDMPMTFLILDFLRKGPAPKFGFISYAYSAGIIKTRDVRNNAVARAFGELLAARKIIKLADGRYARA